MDSLTVIALVVSTLITILYIERMMGVFYASRHTSLHIMFLTYSSYGAATLIYTILFPTLPLDDMAAVLTAMILTFAGYYIITLNYKSSFRKRLVAMFSTYMVFSLVTIPLSLVISHLFTPAHYYAVGDTGSILQLLIIPTFAFFISALLRRFKNVRKTPVVPSALILLIILVFAAVWFLPFAQVFGIDNIFFEVSLIFITVFFVGLVFLIFYLFDTLTAKYEDKLKSERQAQEKEYYFTQCQLMQESAEQVKAIRHDMKIHLATLKDFADNGNLNDVANYLNSLTSDIEKSEIYSDTGNISFDSIINYKLRNAKKDNIKLDLRVAVPPEIDIEVVDIVTVLGNLLDNALEAVAKVSDKYIKLDIEFVKGGLFAKIDNSFNGELKYSKEKNGEERQVVSLKNSSEHGYGLKNIMQSVEKYNGHIKISHTDTIFSAGLFLYVGDVGGV